MDLNMEKERPKKQLQLHFTTSDQDMDFNDQMIEGLLMPETLGKEKRKKAETPMDKLIPFFDIDYTSNRK